MITIDKKSKTAIDIALHIPLPSIRIKVAKEGDAIAENTELSYNRQAENMLESQQLQQQAAQAHMQASALEEDSVKKKPADDSVQDQGELKQ